jgi:hypothetical protein
MSAPDHGDRDAGAPEDGQGVLSNLPRTRPQRSSARRTAARSASQSPPAAKAAPSRPARPAPGKADKAAKPAARAKASAPDSAKPRRAKDAGSSAAKPRARSTARRGPARAAEPVPRQGFESEGERVSGPVQPPGGAEMLATAAEVVSELAKAGISTGERLVRDVLSRLPLS